MVQICALASGSNGNCYYIGNEEEAILVDIGISNRQLSQRMHLSGLSIKKVKAVFISHEHSDHIKGMRIVTQKNNIDGYATRTTYAKARIDHRSFNIKYFEPGDTICIGNIKIHSFSKLHDAIDPVSFRVEIDGVNIAVLTDLGSVSPVVKDNLMLCDAAFLETNYDHDILFTGRYPAFLKQRVASDYGHLSNQQAFDLLSLLNDSPLKKVFLSHISEDNNRVDLVLDKFKTLQEKYQIEPTSRYAASKVLTL